MLYKQALLYKRADPYNKGLNSRQYAQTRVDPAMQRARQMRFADAWRSYQRKPSTRLRNMGTYLGAAGDWGLHTLGVAQGVAGSAHKGLVHAPFSIVSEFGRSPEYANRTADVALSYALPRWKAKYSDIKTTGLQGAMDRMNASANRYTEFFSPGGTPTRLLSIPPKIMDHAGKDVAEHSLDTQPLMQIASRELARQYPLSDNLARTAGQTAAATAGVALNPVVARSAMPRPFKQWWAHTFPQANTPVSWRNAQEVATGVAQGLVTPDAPHR